MPQIAQQDYIKAVATPGRTPGNDCNVYSVLAKALEAGTLFDVIIVFNDFDDINIINEGKILGHDGMGVFFFDAYNSGIQDFTVKYTSTQYTALSEIQRAYDEQEGLMKAIPSLMISVGAKPGLLKLGDSVTPHIVGLPIATPDGYQYAITEDEDGNLATITPSSEYVGGGDFIPLAEETAQDLIGLPIQ